MRTEEVFDLLEQVRKDPSTLNKIEILKKGVNSNLLAAILRMTFEPQYVYGIKKVPKLSDIKDHQSDKILVGDALGIIRQNLVKNKLRGHAATDFIIDTLSKVDAEYRETILQIIQRNLKLDIGIRGINKAIPGLLMDKHYMGAQPYDKIKAEKLCQNPFYSQEKMDGMYANFMLEDLSFISRNIKNVMLNIPELQLKMKDIKKAFGLLGLGPLVLNGELLIKDMSRYTSNGVLNSINKIETKISNGADPAELKELDKLIEIHGDYETLKSRIHFVVWDFIPVKDFKKGFWLKKYRVRLRYLMGILNDSSLNSLDFISLVPTKFFLTLEAAQEHFKEIRAAGGEGTIIKSAEGLWKTGKPVWQLKLKYELEVELLICGFRQGDAGTKYENTLGAYIVRSDDHEILTKAPGLSEIERDYGWKNQDRRINKIVSVKCNGLSQDKDGKYSLLHPRFNGMRPDKDTADSLDEIIIADGGIISEVDFAELEDTKKLTDIL